MSKTVDSGGWRPGGEGGGAAILIVAMSLVVGGVVSLVDVPGVLRVFGVALLCAVVMWAYGTIALAMVNSYQYGKAYAEVQAGKRRDEQVTLTCGSCKRTLSLGRDQRAEELAREMRRCPYCLSTDLHRPGELDVYDGDPSPADDTSGGHLGDKSLEEYKRDVPDQRRIKLLVVHDRDLHGVIPPLAGWSVQQSVRHYVSRAVHAGMLPADTRISGVSTDTELSAHLVRAHSDEWPEVVPGECIPKIVLMGLQG